jgi:hypothetical protein
VIDLSIGILMIVLGLLIFIAQVNNSAFKGPINNGVVHVTFGAIFLIAFGVYFIFSSFK